MAKLLSFWVLEWIHGAESRALSAKLKEPSWIIFPYRYLSPFHYRPSFLKKNLNNVIQLKLFLSHILIMMQAHLWGFFLNLRTLQFVIWLDIIGIELLENVNIQSSLFLPLLHSLIVGLQEYGFSWAVYNLMTSHRNKHQRNWLEKNIKMGALFQSGESTLNHTYTTFQCFYWLLYV